MVSSFPEPKISQLKISIKYMVSARCKMIVKEVLTEFGLHYIMVNLGEAEIMEELTAGQRDLLRAALIKSGFELLEDKKAIMIEKIKNIIVEMVHYEKDLQKTNFSAYLSEIMGYDYTYL